jgi:hypothetical protein
MDEVQRIKSDVIDFMKHHVYRGDFDRPLPEPDAAGLYQYKDDKIRIALSISPRDGWLNCSVDVYVRLRRGLFAKSELVFSTGLGYEVSVFRPGLWCDYVADLAARARAAQHQNNRPEQPPGATTSNHSNFTPIDDSAVFGK